MSVEEQAQQALDTSLWAIQVVSDGVTHWVVDPDGWVLAHTHAEAVAKQVTAAATYGMAALIPWEDVPAGKKRPEVKPLHQIRAEEIQLLAEGVERLGEIVPSYERAYLTAMDGITKVHQARMRRQSFDVRTLMAIAANLVHVSCLMIDRAQRGDLDVAPKGIPVQKPVDPGMN